MVTTRHLAGARAAGPADTALLLLPICKVMERLGHQCTPCSHSLSHLLVPGVLSTELLWLRSLVVFFAIYAGLVNNQRFPRFVRYNGMQAILLDIVLVSRRLIRVKLCLISATLVCAASPLKMLYFEFAVSIHCGARGRDYPTEMKVTGRLRRF